MSSSLRSRTIGALFWGFFERIGQQGIHFIVSMILARLLLPAQFGVIAMLAIFIAVAQAFLDSGFGQALIQKKDATHVDSCSIFYFNVLAGLIAAGLLCLVAPCIAAFYNEPLLTPLTRFLSLNIVINSLSLIQMTRLLKSIDLKALTKVSLIATILSGTIGITLAFKGFGVWSLAIQSVSSSLLRSILLWFFSTWRPSLVFSFTALREMFAFGSRLLASGLLSAISENIYVMVIGKVFSPAALGFYSRAKALQQLPTANLSEVVSRVTFPVFSTIQDDCARLKSGMRKALTSLVFLNFPMMLGLAIVARPLVRVLLTDKWVPCVPYLRLLCIVGMLYPLHVINLNLLKAKGRSDLFLRLEIIKRLLVVVAVAVTYRWGIQAMIYGQIIVSILCCYLNSYYTGKLIDYPLKEQLTNMVPYLGMTAVMGISLYALQSLSFANDWGQLISQAFGGILIYAALNWTFRTSAFVEALELLKVGIMQ